MRLVGLSGSLRAASYNSALLRAAQETAPPDVELIAATIHGIPLYDGDLEAQQGLPEAVVALKDLIAGCDGLLLFTPEYNNSIPGPFKNAIDWMSRGEGLRLFKGKPVAVMGTSPGGFGTIRVFTEELEVLAVVKDQELAFVFSRTEQVAAQTSSSSHHLPELRP